MMIYALRKQRATIYELKTDSVLYRPTRRSDKLFLANLRYKDMAELRDKVEPTTSGMRRLNVRHPLPAYVSEDPVFRVNPAGDRDPMKMEPGCPRRSAVLRYAPPIWRELTKAEATRRVLHGESLAVHGIAGTGKTTYMKEVVEELKGLGNKNRHLR